MMGWKGKIRAHFSFAKAQLGGCIAYRSFLDNVVVVLQGSIAHRPLTAFAAIVPFALYFMLDLLASQLSGVSMSHHTLTINLFYQTLRQ